MKIAMQKEQKENKKETFLKGYEKLVEDTGIAVIGIPVWQPRDDGTFSLVIRLDVTEVPKK